MTPRKSPRDIGKEIEDAVEAFLKTLGADYERGKRCPSAFGLWDIDFYVHASPPVLISCKHPTKGAKHPTNSIIRKAQEAFLQLYGLTHLCPNVPREARVVLVTGPLPLRTRGKDYEAVIANLLGDRFAVIRASEIETLGRLVTLGSRRDVGT